MCISAWKALKVSFKIMKMSTRHIFKHMQELIGQQISQKLKKN